MTKNIDPVAFRNLAGDMGAGFHERGNHSLIREAGSARVLGDSTLPGGSGSRKGSEISRYSERGAAKTSMRESKTRKMRKTDLKEIKKEAKAELKHVKDSATRIYEQTLNEAKLRYLRNAERFRLEYNSAKENARKDYEKALEFAQHDYEFTVDIAKDQYKNEKADAMVDRGESARETGWFEIRHDAPGGASASDHSGRDVDRPPMRLEDEIKQMVEESVAEWGPEYGRIVGEEENW